MEADKFSHPPRNVRPRTRTYKRLPVIVIEGDQFLTEAGEVGTVDALIRQLPFEPSTLFAKRNAADFIASLDEHFSEWYPNWQWRASTSEREIVRPDGFHVATRVSTAIHYFGFKGGAYHKIIDPVTMYGHKLDQIWPGEMGPMTRLLAWATTLRDFCDKNGIELRPTIGSMGAQFLTDRRFYPKRRRKVPAATNERVRTAMPGNHYVLTTIPNPHREFTALYLDQRRAHHYHARVTPLPHSDFLYAYGRFSDLKEIVFRNVWEGFYGLYCLDLEPPTTVRQSYWIRNCEKAFVFSNEIQHLLDMGYRVKGVRAAWGSFKRDTGLTRYAQWADKQLDYYGEQPWLKPLLLATYGTLATRPTMNEAVFRLATNGEEVTLFTGDHCLRGQRVTAPKKLEPRIANVLHRGMIEAATRSESVGYGQHLSKRGFRVLSIYADAVIIRDDDREVPLIDPWRLKTKLNHLRFINQQSFTSGEMTKLPGVGRELLAYRQHSPGHAPRRPMVEAGTGRQIPSDRRI